MTRAWTMPDHTASYLARTLAARDGLWGNHEYEAAYPMTYTDADGNQLNGHNQYTLRFDQDPPVDAFWRPQSFSYLCRQALDRRDCLDRMLITGEQPLATAATQAV